MVEPGTFPSGFPIPPLQTPPNVQVRPDGTFSDPAYADDAVAARIHQVEDALIVDLFHNRFLSQCGAPALEERNEPVAPGQTREVEVGEGRCRTERLVKITTYEKKYCDVTCRWQRWVLPADSEALAGLLTPLEIQPAAEAAAEPAGMGRVVTVHAAAGAGALDTSTDMTFGDAQATFSLGAAAHVEAVLKANGRKVAEGWTPVGFWHESRESTVIPPREDWEPVGDAYPCKKAVPVPPGDDGDEAIAVPGGDEERIPEPAGGSRLPLWGLAALIALLVLLWLLFLRPDSAPLAGDDDGEAIAVADPTIIETVTPTPAPTPTPTPTPTPEVSPTESEAEEPTPQQAAFEELLPGPVSEVTGEGDFNGECGSFTSPITVQRDGDDFTHIQDHGRGRHQISNGKLLLREGVWWTYRSEDTYTEFYIVRVELGDGETLVVGVEAHGPPGSLPAFEEFADLLKSDTELANAIIDEMYYDDSDSILRDEMGIDSDVCTLSFAFLPSRP